jgi:hypothetical protein
MGFTAILSARPVSAHGIGGAEATNLQTRIVDLDPTNETIQVRVVPQTSQIELRLLGATEVVVLGYEDEPYLRVTPEGVEQNLRSPATFLNRSTRPTNLAPSSTSPDAAPEWERISDRPVARWHDHRAHWMGDGDPPHTDDIGPGDLVSAFTIDIVVEGTPTAIRGDLRWIPAAPWWPWILGAGLLAAVLAIAARRAPKVVFTVALCVLILAEAMHVAGLWHDSTEPIPTRIGANAFSVVVVALGILALARLVSRSVHAAAPAMLFAGLAGAIVGGLGDLTSLMRSQLPTALSASFARSLVGVSLGIGIGLVVSTAQHLRPSDAH